MSEENFNEVVGRARVGATPMFSSDERAIIWAQNEIAQLRAERDHLMAQKAKEHRGANEYGLDVGYMTGKLNIFLRDIDRYTRDEAARALARLAITADESVLCEPEFTSTMPSQQSPVMAVPTGITVISGVLVDGCRIDFETVDGLFSDAFNGVLPAREYLYTSPSPRITEQDDREKVLLEAVFKIEKKYFRTIHDHGATENAQMILAELRGMIGLPMILKRDLPEWDGVAYVMPPTSNLVANQPALLNKLNNNPSTQEEKQ